MKFVLQTANVVSDAKNCSYPNRVEVDSPEEMLAAARMDHVCGEYTNNYRSISNFVSSNVAVMDCDNDHSDDEGKWITAEKLEEMFPDVSYAVVYSRHHMKEKDGKSPRPRFHVYFLITEVKDAKYYAALKRAIYRAYPFFDSNALDAARFIFGADGGECVWHEGWDTIDGIVGPVDPDEPGAQEDMETGGGEGSGTILQGCRNKTLSRFAARALKRFGDTDKAKELFLKEAGKCDPPLGKDELWTIWHSALRFYRDKVSRQEGYVAPDAYNDEFGNGSLKPADYSDIGEAKILAREYGDELRYSDATDYIRYNGDFWAEDKQLAVGAQEELLDMQLEEAQSTLAAAIKALTDLGVVEKDIKPGSKKLEKAAADDAKIMEALMQYERARQYLAFVMKRRDYKYITSSLNAAKPMLAVKVEDLDKDEFLLNAPNATYDLRKGMAGELPHDPDDLITKMAECSPDDKGRQMWEDSLQLFFCGNRELIDYVQEVVGMAAIGKVFQEHLIIAYGDGANGKSTFWNTVSRVLGTYSGKLSAETLTTNCKHNVKPEMAELKGKRLIIASEMQEGMRLNTSVVKQLCSTDEVFAEKKYKAPFSFTPSHTIVLYTNHLPRVGANDDGIWRRLIVIPFSACIKGDRDVKNYADRLFEEAGGYVMQWIIEGAQRVISKDFQTKLPECVEEAIASYREDNDWMGQFLRERCDVGDSYKVKSGELYQEYRNYSMENGEYIRSTTDFYAAVDRMGFIRRKTNAGMTVSGLRIRPGTDFL